MNDETANNEDLSIILVDDSDFSRKSMIEILDKEGYSVVGEANSAERAIQIAQTVPCDLFIVDVVMPEVSGIDLAKYLTDNYKALQDKGYEVLGVSADSEKRQANFKAKYRFPFPLLADENKEVINAFGVWGLKKFMGREYDGIHRKTFLINENGIVERVIDKVKTKDHSAQILEQ